MAAGEPIRRRTHTGTGPAPAAREIPDKLYFRIGDVAGLVGVPAYVLRFWETEFPQLKPNKGGTGQRLYRRRDVEMALRIKSLLYDQGYTIAGARQAFKAEPRSPREVKPAARTSAPLEAVAQANPGPTGPAQTSPALASPALAQSERTSRLEAMRRELRELHALLSRPAAMRTPGSTVQPIRAMRPAPAPRPATPPTPFPVPGARSLFDTLEG